MRLLPLDGLPGFQLGVAWLWQRPLPPIGEVVGQIEG